jgi:alpha-tubulin suppressor-like RCC1 family protein
MHTIKRRLGLLLSTAVTVAASVTVIGGGEATAGGNSLYFSNGSDNVTVGANAAIYIDGTITFDANCQGGTRPGIDDFVYPATDVYIVPAGSAADGSGLTDAGGNGPNTIVGTGSGAFIGELIAVVYPSGSLGEGEYDVVYDTCQDGVVDFEDEIWYDAITVDIPDGQLPPVDASIRRVKDAAREEYAAWLKTHMGLTALFKYEDALAIAGCILAPNPGCMIEVLTIIYDVDSVMAQSSNWIEDQSLKLVMNRAKNYGAIWQDPVDPAFAQLPVVIPEQVRPVAFNGSPVADAIAALGEPLADEGALADALLHALERYQGAQAAGDEEWALVQARAAADLSAALAAQLRGSSAVSDLRDAIAADIDDVVARGEQGAAVINRIRTSGVTADERRELRNRGFDDAAIAAVEARFVADGRQVAQQAAGTLAPFDELVAARTEMAAALDESAAGWAALAAALDARVDAPLPIADAGGAYAVVSGPVALDAAGSTTPDGTAIVAIEWDLDGDGAYDDASGPNPEVTLDRSRTVSVRITNDAGYQAVDFAPVSIGTTPVPAATVSPTERAVVLTAGSSQQFAMSVPGASEYRWSVDGEEVADGDSFTFTATPDQVGQHVVSASATHGQRTIAETWVVSVLLADADGDGWTATSDCDDSRADVNPGGFERLGNDRDDDCDANTPDGPVGGLTGELWAWGYYLGVGRGPGPDQPSPVKVSSLGDQVRAIESGGIANGYAVLADGTVRAWGPASSGQLGDGTQNQAMTPVVVANVGGNGALGGVVELTEDSGTAIAVRQDGTVVAWGDNRNGQAGDGTDVDFRLTPVEVIDAESGAPLGGVAHVDYGENSAYAVMADGTVKVWGLNRCSGTYQWTRSPQAVTNPLFGDGIVQLETGDHGGAIALRADGAVLTCSPGMNALLGRGNVSIPPDQTATPLPVPGFGPGSGAIDVAWGMESVAVLKNDGSVWMWGKNLNNSLTAAGVEKGYTAWTPVQVQLPPGPPVVDIEMDYAVTVHALRADGSVVVWGGNVYNSAGNGDYAYNIIGVQGVAVPGDTFALSNSVWNGMAIARPEEPNGDPVLPLHWIDAAIGDAAIVETTGGSVVVTLSEPAPEPVDVEYRFEGVDGSVVIAAGATSAEIPVAVADDAVDEPDAELPITITAVSDGVRTARRTGLVTVVDDDDAPSASIADASVLEGDTSLTDVALTVSLSAAAGSDVVIGVDTLSGSGEHGTDLHAYSGSVLIPAGQTSAVVHVSVAGDAVLEDDESFTVELSNPQNATLADASATVTIYDDEPIVVHVAAPAVIEGDAGVTPAEFAITVEQPPTPVAVRVPWAIAPGTAEADLDVLPAGGELTVTGPEPAVVVAEVVADTADEPLEVESFKLALGEITNAAGRAVVVSDTPAATITDDDDPVVPVVVEAGPDVTGDEGSAITLAGAVDGADEVASQWSVADPACTIADPAAVTTQVTCPDETATSVTLTVGDVSDSAQLLVSNVAPVVTLTAPAPGQSFDVGTPVTANVQVGDPGLDDALVCTITWGDGTTPAPCDEPHAYTAAGARTVTATVVDGDGGVGTAAVDVTIVSVTPAMQFTGFFHPVDNLPVVNVVKAGSTVPLKFSLGGDFGMDIFAAGFPATQKTSCASGERLDSLEETSQPGARTLTYDPATDRYQYNWQTSKSWAGQCHTLVLSFTDGTTATALFRFK